MADNVIVSNAPVSVNPDIPVRSIDKSGEQIQVVAIDYGGAGAENLTVPDFATETTLQTIASTVGTGTISVKPVHDDVLGVAVSGTRNNQIEISFFSSFNTDLITNTNTSTGSATIANGHALYATGTGTSATSKGVTVQTLAYRPAHEEYAYFTAAFTTPTSTNSDQRIGLYDANNGYFIGFDGLTFGLTKRTAAVDTFVARTSWNGDLLDGSASSKFTRNGAPEAINLTFSNLFRIRFAWLGSASVLFEVFSPDGAWITFHTLRVPNAQLNPHIATPDLPMTVEAIKASADATNLIIYTACWAAGTTSNYSKITDTLTDYTLAGLTRSVITGRTTGGGGGYVNVKVNPSGALTTATTIDDISPVDGQKTMALSFPVVIASDQSAVPVSLPNEGQQTMANSISVAIASDQTTLPVAINSSVTLQTQYVANTVVTQKYVVAAGVPTAMAPGSTPITRLDVRAALTNQGLVYFGDSTIGAGKAFYLAPGDAWSFDITDLSLMYYDGDATNDSIVAIYYEA